MQCHVEYVHTFFARCNARAFVLVTKNKVAHNQILVMSEGQNGGSIFGRHPRWQWCHPTARPMHRWGPCSCLVGHTALDFHKLDAIRGLGGIIGGQFSRAQHNTRSRLHWPPELHLVQGRWFNSARYDLMVAPMACSAPLPRHPPARARPDHSSWAGGWTLGIALEFCRTFVALKQIMLGSRQELSTN